MDILLIGFDWDTIDLIESNPEYNLLGYLDRKTIPMETGSEIPRLGTDDDWQNLKQKNPSWKVAFGMDVPQIRAKVFSFFDGDDRIVTLRSPSAHVSARSQVQAGTLIQHGCKVMPLASVGRGCSLNVNAAIHHESELGDFSVLAPGSLVLGRVKIGRECYIGAGAVIKQECSIGDNVIVGAGAVVVNDIPSNSTVVGVPAVRYL